jgi:hypothetical protein
MRPLSGFLLSLILTQGHQSFAVQYLVDGVPSQGTTSSKVHTLKKSHRASGSYDSHFVALLTPTSGAGVIQVFNARTAVDSTLPGQVATLTGNTTGGKANVRSSSWRIPRAYPVTCQPYYDQCEMAAAVDRVPETGLTGNCNDGSDCITTTASVTTVANNVNPSGFSNNQVDSGCQLQSMSNVAIGYTTWTRFDRQIQLDVDLEHASCFSTVSYDLVGDTSSPSDPVYGCRAVDDSGYAA